MKFWVTGKKGLVGAVLAEKAELATGREIDIANLNAVEGFVKQNHGITHIFNCAAYSLVDQAEKEKDEALRANAIGPGNLGKIAKKIGARFIHLSTDYLFDGKVGHPLKETDLPSPLNHYAKTKLEGEKRALAEDPTACILRTSWIFGSGGKNFVAKLFQMLLTQEEITLSDDQWGRPTFVHDLADAIWKMKDQSGIFHYANQGETTKYLFGCQMKEEAEKLGFPVQCKIIHPVPSSAFPSPCKRPTYSAFDTTKIEQFLPIRPWQEGMREFLCMKRVPSAVS